MLTLKAFEFVIRTIPESFLVILGCYVFSNAKFDIKKYIISSILFSIGVYFIRMLPINYGVHTILGIIFINVLLWGINKIEIILAIKSSIIITICLFIIEALNILVLNLIFKENLEYVMSNSMLKTLYGLPTLGILAGIVLFYRKFSSKDNL
jgi:hypothetical protein